MSCTKSFSLRAADPVLLICTNYILRHKKLLKAQAAPLQATKALAGRGGIAPTHSGPRL
jgi:hypothetical protein